LVTRATVLDAGAALWSAQAGIATDLDQVDRKKSVLGELTRWDLEDLGAVALDARHVHRTMVAGVDGHRHDVLLPIEIGVRRSALSLQADLAERFVMMLTGRVVARVRLPPGHAVTRPVHVDVPRDGSHDRDNQEKPLGLPDGDSVRDLGHASGLAPEWRIDRKLSARTGERATREDRSRRATRTP